MGGANFAVSDGAEEIQIVYAGALPDLFREGQGIVAEGTFDPMGRFTAETVLANTVSAVNRPIGSNVPSATMPCPSRNKSGNAPA